LFILGPSFSPPLRVLLAADAEKHFGQGMPSSFDQNAFQRLQQQQNVDMQQMQCTKKQSAEAHYKLCSHRPGARKHDKAQVAFPY
jgi:hypothetical protein